jgi:hypothetical protein
MNEQEQEELRKQALADYREWNHTNDISDQFLSKDTEYLKELTRLAEYPPPEYPRRFWGVFTKDVMLGYLTKEDTLSVRNSVGLVADIDFLNTADYDQTASNLLNIANLKIWSKGLTYRGRDGFERTMQSASTHLAISETRAPAAAIMSPRRGYFRKLFNRGENT